ncbi:unnamed protein product, partial [Rotaria sordida]
ERCTIRQDPVIDSVIFKAYESLQKIALDYGLERELAVPRTVIHWQAKDLCKKLELEIERIEKTHRHEGSFRLELFTVEIASKHYTDFEILDVPSLVRGDLDAN